MDRNMLIHQGNTFEKVMETIDFTYYMDFSEGDDNGSVILFDRETRKLVSDNYMANRDLYENLLYYNYEWICKRLRYARKCMVEEHGIDLAKEYFLKHEKEFQRILCRSENITDKCNMALQKDLGFTLSRNDLQEVRKLLNSNQNKGLSM
ncbi:hypothetical protein MTsPCn5_08750 [Croceitalea sp. MTPC5]|uniref:hypothetical protein n=1 Tax=Croceitalea sp. MTPC5 TaxID=3056565 RepID=UPI002B3AB0E2|nr:hypothetical protein MTsPCn5_08750 [Croceitalea sp. MTPC5]